MEADTVERCQTQERFEAGMREGSRNLIKAIKREQGLLWSCGHEKSWVNTQMFRGEPRCRTCRRLRWLSKFNDIVSRHQATQVYRQRLREEMRRMAAIQREEMTRLREDREHIERLSVETLKNGVCDVFDITLDELMGPARTKKYVHARSVIYRILRGRNHSLPTIGRLMGGKDHSTVINALAKFDWYCTEDPRVRDAYELLKDRADAA